MRRDGDHQVEVAARAGTATALAGHANLLARAHAGWDLHVDVLPLLLPAAAVAGRARLAAHVAGAAAGRANLLDVEGERLARAVVGFLQRDRDVDLDVGSARGATAVAGAAAEQIFEVDRSAAGAAARAHVAEDRPEEVGKVAGVAIFHPHAAGLTGGSGLRVTLPVGTQSVVAAALLGIGEDLVGLRDLFELLAAGVLTLGHIRVILPGQPTVRGLDRLVVGRPIDPENRVVVPEFDAHSSKPMGKCSRPF